MGFIVDEWLKNLKTNSNQTTAHSNQLDRYSDHPQGNANKLLYDRIQKSKIKDIYWNLTQRGCQWFLQFNVYLIEQHISQPF